ncbi:MAG TPA: serine/threonine-protein kinase, partial [Modestobacter sp.]|nr:serine/threonine-protein kinase [Modestobacter sp.]
RLTHPHAVSVYDMVDDGGTPWLVMEYLPSRSLAQVLADGGTLPVTQVAQIGAQVADALIATHAAGVVHRDVKPANILIGEGPGRDGVVKITDFGISRAVGDVSLTQTGVVKGTPAYLAPEVARGQEPNEASDVFSLGATIYACLEGTPPFGMTENPLEMLYRVAGGDFQRPRHAGALTRSLMRMLHSDPGKRPGMTEVRDQLAQLAAGRDRDVVEVLTARTPLPPTLVDMPAVGSRVQPAVPATAERAVPAETPARAAVEPVIAPPEPPAGPPPVHPPAAARRAAPPPARRRGRLVALAALVAVAALLVALGVIWQNRQDDAPTPSAGPGSTPSASTSAPTTPEPSPTPTTESSAPSTTASAPSTTAEPSPTTSAGPAAGSAAEVEQALTSYYALLPQNAQRAYDLTGPTLRSAESRGNYIAFWKRFSSVTLGPVSATDGSLTATASVTYVENGAAVPEEHTFVLVRGDGGRLLVDSDRKR